MSITALKRDVAAMKTFRSSFAFGKHSDTDAPDRGNVTFYNAGEVADAELSWTEILSKKTTAGKQHMIGAAITLMFTLLQTSDTELAAMDDIVRENVYGTTVKATDGFCSGGDTELSAAAGIVFENCAVQHAGNINLSGGDSGIVVKVTGEVDLAGLAALGVRGLGGDYSANERRLRFDAC